MRKWYSLIDKVYNIENIRKAYKRVRANKGAPGLDGETVEEYGENLEDNLKQLHHELKSGTFQPVPVLRVEIDKEDGKSKRKLGIPIVKDRIVQQALLNILQPIFDPHFHPSSYGYRPGRSPQQAVAKAERFMNKYGLPYVVDMDLSKCFDRLDHELILKSINTRVSDGKVLKLIKSFLEAGVMVGGRVEKTDVGSPQGGVISPLLANCYLDYFDQSMKARGIRIVRFADDILVFAKTPEQAKEYERIAVELLEDELKLTVNREKTHRTSVYKGVAFLGVIIHRKFVAINPVKLKKFKDKIRKITKRNQGPNLEEVIEKLNPVLRGWINYFRIANCKEHVQALMEWIRRRLRMKKMKEWKSWKPLHQQLRRMGYKGSFEKISVTRWRNSASPLVNMALPNRWFHHEMGLVDLTKYEVGLLHQYYEV